MKQVIDACRKAAPRWLAALVTGALAFTAVVAVSAAPASAATGLEVYVGYADNLHATPSHFPAPWSNSPGVTFNGCTGSCVFNGGAVRLVNNTSAAATVNSISVTFDTCTWDFWQRDVVIQPGGQLIIAQTVSGTSEGCDNQSGHFDTSNIGPNNADWSGNCTQSGVVAQINATIDNVANTFTDTKQVLNTGGVDLASCPTGTNKSQQWSPVGTRCPVASIRLTPATQTQMLGTTATMRATVTNSCGNPLQGAAVTFADLNGPNYRSQGTFVTDATGTATFPFTSTEPAMFGLGTDTFQALVTNSAGTFGSGHITVTWVPKQPTLTITGATSSDYNTPATVAASLTGTAGRVDGQPVVFKLNNSETCTGTTDVYGSASCSLTPQEAAGTYTLTATFPGTFTDLTSTATAPFTINDNQTTLTFTTPTAATNGHPLTLSRMLREDSVASRMTASRISR